MSKNLKLQFACCGYDRMEPLRDGSVHSDGIDLQNIVLESPREIFDRMVLGNEFDLGEMSSSQFIKQIVEGDHTFAALPVFPSRLFRHGFIFINQRSGIRSPSDMAGKRIGVPLYTQTAAVWIRGTLRDHYNVDLSAVRWIEGAMEEPGGHGKTQNYLGPNSKIDLVQNRSGSSLSDLLAGGEIDALIGAGKPSCFGRHPDVRRLFDNHRQVEKDYYRKTKIYPIMHLLVIRRAIYEQHPWIASSLFKAFVESKNLAVRRMRFSAAPRYMLPWLGDDIEEMDDVLGKDPWPYGVEINRPTLDALVHHMWDEGLIDRQPRLEELFLSCE